jgi:hypothetical protein
MAVILEAMPFSAAWRKRQNRIQAIQRLDGASESTQKTAACAGSFEVQANDVRRLRIITGHITNYATSAVGAQIAATLDWLTPASLARR